MNDLSIFLNTEVVNSGVLSWIGDAGLAPFRYLFNGKTISIETRASGRRIEIHHVASFHERGVWNGSTSNSTLRSASTSMIKTVLAIVLLVPGLLLSIFKGLAYLFTDENHRLAKEHFTPVTREIGTPAHPITTISQLSVALDDERRSDPKNRPTDALIIHGDGNLEITADPGILDFNPMKLILVGARIVPQPVLRHPLSDVMARTGKWRNEQAPSVIEALASAAPRREWLSCKRYHTIFQLARPQTVYMLFVERCARRNPAPFRGGLKRAFLWQESYNRRRISSL